MCGIVGQARATAARSTASWSRAMCAGLEHRGPDSRGVARRRPGRPRHPAPAGHRPRHRRPADLQRGPLGRRRPQRRDLQLPRAARASCGAAATASPRDGDTEVDRPPLRGGGARLRRARCTGCSRFALWDARRAELLLARDRVGKKPLFYASAAARSPSPPSCGRCSQDPEIPREVDPAGARPLPRLRLRARARSAPSARCASCRPRTLLRWRDGASHDRALLAARLSARSSRSAESSEAGELIRDAVARGGPAAAWSPTSRSAPSSPAASTPRRSSRRWPSSSPSRCGRSRSASTTSGFDELPDARAGRRALRHRPPRARSSGPTRSSCCRSSSATTASRSPTTRRSRASTWPSWPAATSPSRSTATAATRSSAATGATRQRRVASASTRCRAGCAAPSPRRLRGCRPDGDVDSLAQPRAPRLPRCCRSAPRQRYVRYDVAASASPTRPRSTRRVLARRSTGSAGRDVIAEPWRGLAARRPRRPDARGRPADLPPRRPARQDGHRDDGLRARGALAAARPRADGARRRRSPPRSRCAGARRRSSCAPRCAAGCRTTCLDRPKQGFPVPMAEWLRTDLRELARETLLGERRRRAAATCARTSSPACWSATSPARRTTPRCSGASSSSSSGSSRSSRAGRARERPMRSPERGRRVLILVPGVLGEQLSGPEIRAVRLGQALGGASTR